MSITISLLIHDIAIALLDKRKRRYRIINKKAALGAAFLFIMRSERLELSQLSPPPPQDGVSTIPP